MPQIEIIAPGLDEKTIEALTSLCEKLIEQGYSPQRVMRRFVTYLEDYEGEPKDFDMKAAAQYSLKCSKKG